MRILTVELVPATHAPDRPRFCHDLGVAVALLKQAGFETALTAMARYDHDQLRAAVNQHRPTHVLIHVPPARVTAARHTIVDIGEKHFLPAILVGPYVTARPAEAISIPGAAAVIRGEYDYALVTLLQRLDAGAAPPGDVPGVWVNSEDGLIRNDPAPPIDNLDALPRPDREIFRCADSVAVDGEATFQASRGCGNWCAHCLNDWYISLYGENRWPRHRSVANVLDEVDEVTGTFDAVRTVAFTDHAFAADVDWLERFAEEYPKRCGLPYRCQVGLNNLSDRAPEMLAASGCGLADVHVGSGSNFIRNEVLTLRTSRRQIINGVAALHDAELRVRGSIFVGAPYESEVSVEETFELLAALKLDAVRPRVFYPIPGTRAAEVCAENGWISGRGEDNFDAQHSVLDMPSLPARRIDEIHRRYHTLLKRHSGRSLGALWRRFTEISTQPLHLFRRRK